MSDKLLNMEEMPYSYVELHVYIRVQNINDQNTIHAESQKILHILRSYQGIDKWSIKIESLNAPVMELAMYNFTTHICDELLNDLEPYKCLIYGLGLDPEEVKRSIEPEWLICDHFIGRKDWKLSYQDYLKSGHWQETRLKALDYAGNRCQVCNIEKSKDVVLHVHHRTYERMGEERPQDLTVLCADCHKLFHDNRRLKQ